MLVMQLWSMSCLRIQIWFHFKVVAFDSVSEVPAGELFSKVIRRRTAGGRGLEGMCPAFWDLGVWSSILGRNWSDMSYIRGSFVPDNLIHHHRWNFLVNQIIWYHRTYQCYVLTQSSGCHYAVEFRYNTLQNNTILHAALHCQSQNIIIGSGNGLSPMRRQGITWTNAVLMSAVILATNVNKIGFNL